jgi:phosphatidylglycerophosphatase C
MKKKIAFFDFDGTLTTKDTLLEIIKYQKGTILFYLGFLLNAPWMLAFKLKLISNQKAKEKMLQYFFGGSNAATFQQKCDAFALEKIEGLMRPKAKLEIEKHLQQGTKVVIVSASAQNWFQKYFENKSIEILSTQLQTSNGKITGKIVAKNCHGLEKVSRIKNTYNLAEYDEVYAYGDTKGDKPMLWLATFQFYKPFR